MKVFDKLKLMMMALVEESLESPKSLGFFLTSMCMSGLNFFAIHPIVNPIVVEIHSSFGGQL